MKNASEHAGYSAALELLFDMRARLDLLNGEHSQACAALSFKNDGHAPSAGPLDRARAMLDGKPMPATRAENIDALRVRELELRGQLEILNPAINAQATVVEIERTRARAAALESRKKELDGVRKKMDDAVASLRAAIIAEDKILDELVAGGFGRQEPGITTAAWMNRELFVEQTAG